MLHATFMRSVCQEIGDRKICGQYYLIAEFLNFKRQ